MAFTHLHVHSDHSLLDGLHLVKSIPSVMASKGQTAGAITDHGTLHGAYAFHEECLEVGIKPIIGEEFYLAIGSRHERNSVNVDNDDDTATDAENVTEKKKLYMHLTVLAKNEEGWKSLLALHNKSEGSYWYKPRIDFELLKEHGKGLIVLTGCLGGPIAGPLAAVGKLRSQMADLMEQGKAASQRGDQVRRGELLSEYENLRGQLEQRQKEAEQNLAKLTRAVGKSNVFVEVMYHGIEAEAHALRELVGFSRKHGLKMVATNDCHYSHPEDFRAHDALLSLGRGKNNDTRRINTPKRFRFNGNHSYYIRSEEEMNAVVDELGDNDLRQEWLQAVQNTQLVVDMVADTTIPAPKQRLPMFPVPDGRGTDQEYMESLVLEGVDHKIKDPEHREAHLRRLHDVEFPVIRRFGVASYFLILWDVISWCRSDYTPEDWITLRSGGVVDEETRLRRKPILVGPGRGSAAGADIAFMLDITGLDPITNDLLFERFLSPDRVGLPDIDVDFEKLRRAEVHAYLQLRWGAENVAFLGTFGVLKTKEALKSAARALHIDPEGERLYTQISRGGDSPYSGRLPLGLDRARREDGQSLLRPLYGQGEVNLGGRSFADYSKNLTATINNITSLVPVHGGKPVPVAVLRDTENTETDGFRDRLSKNIDPATAHDLVELADRFENVTRSESKHACGFIVSPDPLDEIVPMRWNSHKADADTTIPRVITFTGPECESLGLLKMDVLGLMNLDIAHLAMDYIKAAQPEMEWLQLDTIPDPSELDDPRVKAAFDMLSLGKTAGVFQLESDGMIAILQDVRPRSLDDLSAVVALYRPGPLGANMHTDYGNRKAGRSPITYDQFTRDPKRQAALHKVLGRDYGMAIYQETIMLLSELVGGFDGAQRSALRKAISKKKGLEKLYEEWMEGASKTVVDETTQEERSIPFTQDEAQRLWDFIYAAGDYLFNKSHSAAYGQLAFQTAYLKANWPVEYGAALLAVAGKDKKEKRAATFVSLREEGFEISAPDVNTGWVNTSPVDGRVVIGLAEISGMGESQAAAIVAEREANGPFSSFADFFARVLVRNDKGAEQSLNATELAGLIEAGALDGLGAPRLGMLMASRAMKSGAVPEPWEWNPFELAARQRGRIGLSVGEHPLLTLRRERAEAMRAASQRPQGAPVQSPFEWPKLSTISHLEDMFSLADRSGFTSVAVVSEYEEKAYSGGVMGRLTLEGVGGSVGAVMFNQALQSMSANGYTPTPGDIVWVSGVVKVRAYAIETEEITPEGDVVTHEEERVSTSLNINQMEVVPGTAGPAVYTGGPVPVSNVSSLAWSALTFSPDGDGPGDGVDLLQGQMALLQVEPADALEGASGGEDVSTDYPARPAAAADDSWMGFGAGQVMADPWSSIPPASPQDEDEEETRSALTILSGAVPWTDDVPRLAAGPVTPSPRPNPHQGEETVTAPPPTPDEALTPTPPTAPSRTHLAVLPEPTTNSPSAGEDTHSPGRVDTPAEAPPNNVIPFTSPSSEEGLPVLLFAANGVNDLFQIGKKKTDLYATSPAAEAILEKFNDGQIPAGFLSKIKDKERWRRGHVLFRVEFDDTPFLIYVASNKAEINDGNVTGPPSKEQIRRFATESTLRDTVLSIAAPANGSEPVWTQVESHPRITCTKATERRINLRDLWAQVSPDTSQAQA